MVLTAILTRDPDGGYVALNPETGTTTQGDTVDEALVNLREATELYLEEFPMEDAFPVPFDDFRGGPCLSFPRIGGRECIAALQKLGFVVARQRGSHIMMRKGERGCVVPNHREIRVGTLGGVLAPGWS